MSLYFLNENISFPQANKDYLDFLGQYFSDQVKSIINDATVWPVKGVSIDRWVL